MSRRARPFALSRGWPLAAVLAPSIAFAQGTPEDSFVDTGGEQYLDDYSGSGGVRVAEGVRPRDVPAEHLVQRGDTLWGITGRYLGNSYEWPRIWSYNPDITNPHWIYPMDRVRLRVDGQAAIGVLPTPRGTGLGLSSRAAERLAPGTVWLRDQGYIDRDALAASGVIIGSPEERMMLSPFDEVYIRFDNDGEARPNREFTVFAEVPEEERLPDEEGILVRILGTVRLASFDRERRIGRGTVIEALDPIERGMRVATMPRRFDMVPPRVNERDLEGKVIATLLPRELVAEQQIVFVDLGAEDGVALGNRFFVVRQGDRLRDSGRSMEALGAHTEAPEEPEEYPVEVIAEARVVNVRPHTAALMVTTSISEVSIGDRLEMRAGF